MNLDEELSIEVSPWRGRLITLGVLAGAIAVIAVVVYAFFFTEEPETTRPTEDVVVGRATINANLIVSGVAEAQLISDLTFRTSGRIGSINVAVGDVVKEGDVLAALESEELDNAVASAQASLAAARARLASLLEGATDAELTSAAQSVVQAENALNNATRDLADLLDGANQAQITADVQAVIAAEAGLNDALRARQDLIDGATEVQITNANQAVISAQAGLNQAMRDRQDLLEGPTDTQIAQVEQSIAAAEANLASALASLERLTSGPDDAVVAAAEAQVAAAEQGLTSAQVAQQSALSNVNTAEAGLLAAGATYCNEEPIDNICPLTEGPVPAVDIDDLLDDLADPGTDEELIFPINNLIQANAAFITALNSVATANQALESAQASLAAAEANLDAVNDAPNVEDVAAAEAAITAAEEGLTLAQLNLQDLFDEADADDIARADDAILTARGALDVAIIAQEDLLGGPDDDEFARVEDNIRTAEAALDTAQARLDDLLDNPESNDIARAEDARRGASAAVATAREALAETERGARQTQIDQERASVRNAELAVEAANIRRRNSQIVSPFDGTVAAVNLKLGEFSGASAEPPIVLLTPDAVVLDMNIGETDYLNVKLDQTGVALFDAIPGRPYPFRVIEVGLSPSSNQGVVTYNVKGAIVILPDAPTPSPGMSANGQIITDSRPDVIAIPPRAIRRSGGNQVVDLKQGGTIVEQVVITGASDINNVEVLEGLSEGDTIVVPSLVGGRQAGDEPDPTLPAGIR